MFDRLAVQRQVEATATGGFLWVGSCLATWCQVVTSRLGGGVLLVGAFLPLGTGRSPLKWAAVEFSHVHVVRPVVCLVCQSLFSGFWVSG